MTAAQDRRTASLQRLAVVCAAIVAVLLAAPVQAARPALLPDGAPGRFVDPTEPEAPAPLPEGVTSVQLDLASAYDRALHHSPLMRASRVGVDAVEAKLREANAARWPTLRASSFVSALPAQKAGSTGANVFTDYDWTSVGPLVISELSFAQPLFTFGKLNALRHLAKQGIAIARAVDAVARAELRYQIERGYWALVLASELQAIFEKGRKKLVEERERLELARDDGEEDFDPKDLLKLRMIEADFEAKRRESIRAGAFAADALRAAMGLPDAVTLVPRHASLVPVEVELLPMADYELIAWTNHPRLVAQRRGTAARLQEVELRRLEFWPNIALTGRIAYTYAPTRDEQFDSFATNPANPAQSGAGVALRWNIDIFKRLAKLDQARAAYRKQREGERAEADKVKVGTRKLVRECRDAHAMVEIEGRAMRAARGFLTAQNEMHENGFVGFDEVLKALEQYYRRKLGHLQAIYTWNTTAASLSRSIGVDVRALAQRAPTTARSTPRESPAHLGR